MNANELEALLRKRDRKNSRNAVVVVLLLSALGFFAWREYVKNSREWGPFSDLAWKAGLDRENGRSVADMKAAR